MFADLHIHMVLDGVYYRAAIDSHRPHPDDGKIRAQLRRYRDMGVNFLRDGGDAWGVCLRARELAAQYGITYRCPAFPIHKKGHYGAFIGRGYETLEDYEALLDEAERRNADFVKLMISGLIDFSEPNRLTEGSLEGEEIIRLIERAHRRGFSVMAHANGDEAVLAALEGGVDSVEHGAFLSEATLLRMKNTIWVPTLSTIGNLIGSGRFPDGVLKELLKSQQEKVCFARAHGGLIGLGSDAGAYRVSHARAIEQERAYLHMLSDEEIQRAEAFAAEQFRR